MTAPGPDAHRRAHTIAHRGFTLSGTGCALGILAVISAILDPTGPLWAVCVGVGCAATTIGAAIVSHATQLHQQANENHR